MSSSLIGDDEVVIGVVGGGGAGRVEGHLVCFAFQSPMDGWMCVGVLVCWMMCCCCCIDFESVGAF